ncbi:MAG: helix-turn-helix transcriptional regulator [Alphaproteobacteria bacterium]|nr:helix-turn-helix transcriptional regulator [Alphaproteobacteria bacterium]
MITIEQIRAARALIGWNQDELAEHAGLSQTGIARIENGVNQPNSSTVKKIIHAFDMHDIEFLGESGVKKRTNEVRILEGNQGFRDFMDDVYMVTKSTKKDQFNEICVSNVDERNWIRWMEREKYNEHAKRMAALPNNYSFKIFIQEKDDFFLANDFAEYKSLPSNYFTDHSFYVYGDRLALIDFGDKVNVNIINNPRWAKSFRRLFNYAWDKTPKIG